MTVSLTEIEKIGFFHTALCDGLSLIGSYGFQFDYNSDEYQLSRAKLAEYDSICREDVWVQMLKDGYKLTLIDVEGEGKETSNITMQDVLNRIENSPLENLAAIHNEQYDANDADSVLQTVFFGEVRYF